VEMMLCLVQVIKAIVSCKTTIPATALDNLTRGSEWSLVLSVICPQFLVFAVILANILMFTVFGENTV